MTQRELGLATGYTESQICRFERGAKPPELTTLVALFAPALGITDSASEVAQVLELAAELRSEDLSGLRVTSTTASDKTMLAVAAHVPAPATALIGRVMELDHLCSMLASSVRLVTLSGPPGVGKSRLAIELARATGSSFRDGTIFVGLAPLDSADQFIEAVAQALPMPLQDGQSKRDAVGLALRDKSLLLVLDNFEHMLDAGPVVSEWLRRAPGLKVMTTSRVLLGLSGEHEYCVAPLALPAIAPLPSLAQLRDVPAVKLFVERTRAVAASFELDETNALSVAALCVRLDGLPLAIELAAVRSRMLAPGALLSELVRDDRSRLKLLTRNAKDAARHHSSLRAAIAWSVERLTAPQRAAFALLGMLPTDIPLDLALEVAAANLEVIEALREHSLIQIEHPQGQTRVYMLESLRDYAREMLAAEQDVTSKERLAAQRRLLTWCYALAGPLLRGDAYRLQSTFDFGRFKREQHILLTVLAWCVQNDLPSGLRLACAASHAWYRLADYSTGRDWLRRFIDARTDDAICRATALHNLGLLEERCGAYQASHLLLSEAHGIFVAEGEALEAAVVSVRMADIYYSNGGQMEQAEALCRMALPEFEKAADATSLAWLYSVLGRACAGRHPQSEVERCFDLSISHTMHSSDQHAQAWLYSVAGDSDLDFGKFERARERLLSGLRHARALGNAAAEFYALLRLTSAARLRAHREDGSALARAALGIADRCHMPGYVAQLAMLVVLWLMPGQSESARLALYGAALGAYARVLDRLPLSDATALREWLAHCERNLGEAMIGAALRAGQSCDYVRLVEAVRGALTTPA